MDSDARPLAITLTASVNPAPHAARATAVAAAPTTPSGGRPLTRTSLATTIVFLGLAALDTFEPTTLVSGSWWLVLLLVWLVPWPPRAFDTARPMQMRWDEIQALVTLAVFSWLYLRANTALLEAATHWAFPQLEGKLIALNFVLQDVVVGLVTAALFARPLQRGFPRQTVTVAFLVSVPWFILTCTDTAFDLVRWSEKLTGNGVFLFEALFPPLLLMHACARLDTTATPPGPRFTAARLRALLDRGPRWRMPSMLPPVLALTLLAIGVRAHFDDAANLNAVLGTLLTTLLPLCALLLTVAAVHEMRKRRGLHPHPGHWRRFTGRFDDASAVLMLSLLWSWVFFVDAPLAEHYARDTIASLPGPDWAIDYDARRKTLTLSGEYQFGVAEAFAAALEKYPHARTVELAGPGGREMEGLAIAYAIEDRNLVTRAVGDCDSACTLAFLAGRERILHQDGRLGFHAVSSPVYVWNLNENYDGYLASRGVPPEFIARAAATPSDDMWYPTRDELLAAHVITAVR